LTDVTNVTDINAVETVASEFYSLLDTVFDSGEEKLHKQFTANVSRFEVVKS